MKQIVLERADLESCVGEAQQERIVPTRKGRSVAAVVGVEGADPEQLQLGTSDKLWKLITRRRKQKPLTRTKLEEKLGGRE